MQSLTLSPPLLPPSSSSFSSTFFNLRDPKPKPTLILLYSFLFLSLLSLTLILYLSHSTIHTHSGPDPFLHPTHAHRLVFDPHKPSPPPPPAVAYLISGSRGDAARILRLLNAVYHPLNVYLLHLDASAPHAERELVAVTVQSNPIFKAAQNAHVVGKPDFSYPKGSSPVSLRLHAASVLLRLSRDWDWFVSLSADAYPLVTQDVLCNSRQFNRTVINKNLLYAVQDNQRNDVRPLNSTDFDDMIQSGAIFGEKFQKDDPVLDLIDRDLLGRTRRSVVPGGWCLGEPGNNTCLTWGDAKILRPGEGSQRLEKAIVELLANGIFRSRQCIYI